MKIYIKKIIELGILEEFHEVDKIAQLCYLFPGIQQLKRNLICQYMADYIIASTLKVLVVTITGL